MKYLLKHKGYFGEVYYSDEDECYVGMVLGIRGMIAVHEDTASETIKELIDSIDDYLQFCEEEEYLPNVTDPKVALELEQYFFHESCSDINLKIVPVRSELAVAS